MDLKGLLPKKNDDVENFWSVIIEPEWVSAGIWRLKDKNVQVISISPPSAWTTDEDLITACDASCSSIVQSFPEDVEPPSKTVFGVMSSWVEGGEIKLEYLSKIKKVCSELSLTPVGFVVMAEALSNYLKSEEGGGVNAIFVGVSSENLELSIFRLGKLVGVSLVARSVSIVEDVAEGLARFYSGEAYPSRIILFNSKEGDLDEAKQELIKTDWEGFDKIKFLHTPKIEVIDPDKKIYAVCLAGGLEMGGVDKVQPLNVKDQFEKVVETEGEPDFSVTTAEDLNEPGVSNITGPSEDVTPEDFGFTVDKDSSDTEGIEFDRNFKEVDAFGRGNVQSQAPIEKPVEAGLEAKKGRRNIFSFLKKIHLPSRKIQKPATGFKLPTPKPLLIGLIILILLTVGMFAFWWFFPVADVSLYVAPKKIEDETEISVDTSTSSTDFEGKILSGETLKQKLSDEKTSPTTGTKVVGDKASGEITIYRSGNALNLTKDTLVKGPQGLNFSLNEDITVASGSVLSRGVTKAKVTAKEIGAQFNLASGATFSMSNYSTSDMEATNESSFSGGSSREVRAVSTDDQNNLLKELQDQVESKLKETLSENTPEDSMMIEESTAYSVLSKDFDKKVGDEGESLTLNLDVEAEGVTIKKSDIEELGLKYLSQKVPSGYTLKNDQIQADFSYGSKEESVYNLQLFVSADLLPQVNIDDIRKNIRGKYPDVAEEYMSKNVPGFVRAVINFKRIRLPGRLGTLPQVPGNIEISVSAEK